MGVNFSERARLKAVTEDRRQRVASYKVRGLSLRDTLAAMTADGCTNPDTGEPWSLGVVSKDLQVLSKVWREAAQRDIGEHIARELATCDEIEREAWAAWRRSVGKKQKTVSGSTGVGDSRRATARVETEEQDGDPRFLAMVDAAQKRRAALLGLDAPARTDGMTRGGPGVEVTDARTRLAAMVTKRLQPVRLALAASGGELVPPPGPAAAPGAPDVRERLLARVAARADAGPADGGPGGSEPGGS